LTAALLEAAAAGLPDVVVVISPGKEALRTFLEPDRWGRVEARAELAPLRALLGRLRVRIAEQPEPLGVLDAVERGCRLLEPGPYAVLFPDQIHLPDQRGLAALVAAHEACGETVFALVDGETLAENASSAVAELAEGPHPEPALRLRTIRRAVGAPAGTPCTAFAAIHAPAYDAEVGRTARAEGVLRDGKHLEALERLAAAGRLFGHRLNGRILDLGDPAQYRDEYREALMGVIEAKVEGRQVVQAAEEPAGALIDLMAALEASVNAARASRAEPTTVAQARERSDSRSKATAEPAPAAAPGEAAEETTEETRPVRRRKTA